MIWIYVGVLGEGGFWKVLFILYKYIGYKTQIITCYYLSFVLCMYVFVQCWILYVFLWPRSKCPFFEVLKKEDISRGGSWWLFCYPGNHFLIRRSANWVTVHNLIMKFVKRPYTIVISLTVSSRVFWKFLRSTASTL